MMAENNEAPKQYALVPTAPVANHLTAQKMFDAYQEVVKRAIVSSLDYEVLTSAFWNSARKTPALYKCTQESMLSALMHCAAVSLVPDDPRQQCHLVPFGNEVVWIAGYRGLIELARRTKQITTVYAEPVYEGDDFDWQKGTDPFIKHKSLIDPGEATDDKITHFYSVIFWTDPNVFPRYDFEVMTKSQVDAIRDGRRGGRRGDPWDKYYSEQGRKTVLRRHSKRWPMDPMLALAVQLDDKAAAGVGQPTHELVEAIIEQMTPTTAENLTEKMKQKADATGEQPRAWSTDDLERLWKERGMGLSIERRSVVEGDMSSGDCLADDYIAELCEELSALEPQ